ncbi:MAG: hypothetical protein OJJ21_16670 [Ferrovibrio sp.]|uniref:hypothetical protein n=1 Tax=Ferrovibrio sp. TaxID=1917215 RepID=UPI00262B81A1|nr:hypothetical protein [Ferrovibrio sp.]MCW0235236.1 hypothetical protein [Ferrovibrio sp.]
MTLLLLICLATAPNQCRTEQIPTTAQLPAQCFAAAQEWAVQHPRYRLAKWRCGRRVVEI